MSARPQTTYRHDYRPYPFTIHKVELRFELEPNTTRVSNRMQIQAKKNQLNDLILDGEDIQLEEILLDGKPLHDYVYVNNQLILKNLQGTFELEIISTCSPKNNTSLMGLYVSGKSFFTQCEAEGFRRITFFADRPDVMSEYSVTLEADKTLYPILLSNGNLISSQDIGNGRHQAVWHDPFLKPCYLFALVAGDFDLHEKTSRTRSGRSVLLQVYSDKGSGEQTLWALDCLERSMFWDQQRFGLELDLDRFMVVAVRDFNMGAMENKGLNIFNAAYVLADPETATDANYEGIESVIGHEYFHNWTGNRITCQDWFQLSLKEGLTVFRDQEFSADMMARHLPESAANSARAVKRIEDVSRLRAAQFPEDAGPMAHPIRPESYQEIANFYTATVYEKGAEVIRMQHTLLGEAGFRAGMDEYFKRHDGQAVTCDDFLEAMQSVYTQNNPNKDLSVFRRWYSQAGTPRVSVNTQYDTAKRTYSIRLSQRCEKVGIEKHHPDFIKLPFHIPVHIGLLNQQGRALKLNTSISSNSSIHTSGDGIILELKEESATWVLNDIPEAPIISLLRDFSAPVVIEYERNNQELAILCAHDTNHFARWEAVQELSTREILRLSQLIHTEQNLCLDPVLIEVWRNTLEDPDVDAAYRAWLLSLPAEKILNERITGAIQPLAIAQTRQWMEQQLAHVLRPLWQETYRRHHTQEPYTPDPVSTGHRRLKNLALQYLSSINDMEAIKWAQHQYQDAEHMTDRMGALNALVHSEQTQAHQTALADFYQRFADNPLVVDKWFSLQATASHTRVEHARQLLEHPAFTLRNPNRARALIFQFCLNNSLGFHQTNGSAYSFWAEQVLALDALNPEIAARLARALDNWARFAEPHKTHMQNALQQIHNSSTLSKNTREIINKALNI